MGRKCNGGKKQQTKGQIKPKSFPIIILGDVSVMWTDELDVTETLH